MSTQPESREEAVARLNRSASDLEARTTSDKTADAVAQAVAGKAYRIVAELIGSSSGIGHMITDSQALLATDQIIFGIIVIGVIGLVSDLAFKWANRRLFPWALIAR